MDFDKLIKQSLGKVVIFLKPGCPYCKKLKTSLELKKIPFVQYIIDSAIESDKLKESSKFRTFPQLFINQQLIGGYSEFLNLEMTNSLESLLLPCNIKISYDF